MTSIWLIWKVRNDAIFKDKSPSLHHVMTCTNNGVSKAYYLENGCMRNSISDLLILLRLNIKGRVGKAPKIIEVQWLPLNPGWIKVNTDGSANGSPDPASCSGVFQTYRGFCKGCFSCPIGVAYAFEAELLDIITALDYAKTISLG